MPSPQLSIIITHYKTPHLLLSCLKSIKENLQEIKSEIFVADSATNAGTAFLVKYHHPKTNYLSFKENVGYARLVNGGLKKATGKFVLILNADTVIDDPSSIKKMMEFLEAHSKVGIVGLRLINIDNSIQKSYFREYTFEAVLARRTCFKKTRRGKDALRRFEMKDFEQDKPFEVDWVMGSAMMTKKEYVDKIGLMDERYFMYFEDLDWCRRFREAGFKIYHLPQAKIRHFHLKSSDSKRGIIDIFTNKLTRIHIMSYFKYLWKWRDKKNN